MSKKMGIYCKAYQLEQLRAYENWSENALAARPDGDGDDSSGPRQLDADCVVYVQENFVVTDGIFKDENIIFDSVDDEWIEFCRVNLRFAIPEDVLRANQLVTA